ncbi:MAG: hypothetical protein PVH19_01550 [Planctomycetia bacterium]|jgi:hypothetical protein
MMEKRSHSLGGLRRQVPRFLSCLLLVGVMAIASHADTTQAKKLPLQQRPLLERQNWIAYMLQRLDRANQVVLDPKYVERQHERLRKLSRPLLLTTPNEEARKTAETIRDEVEQVERVAIEHLDRQFRQALEETFHDPAKLSLRQKWFEGWQTTVQAWQKSTDRVDRLPQLIDWLQKSNAALANKQYAVVTPIPDLPAAPLPWETAQHTVQRPIDPLDSQPGIAKPALKVNLPELAAQISGNNFALRRLKAKLITEKQWDATQIEHYLTQLKPLATRIADTQMIYNLLAPEQQRQVDTIIDPKAMIQTLREKIRDARITVLNEQDDSAALTNEQRTELQNLDRLTGDLDEIDPNPK